MDVNNYDTPEVEEIVADVDMKSTIDFSYNSTDKIATFEKEEEDFVIEPNTGNKLYLGDLSTYTLDYTFLDATVVYKGELCYVSNSEIKDNEKQAKWCQEIGIKIISEQEFIELIK